ncbi:MAG TPA: endonuclease III [Blastocatellia bacterium]|nr:endonuclease III [Blastocatellia bacterium]
MKLPNSSAELTEKRHQLKFITQNLEATYGVPSNDSLEDPLDELIATILSQSTTNINSHRAFASLKARFLDWESVRRALPASIAAAIKSGGLANVKSIVIKNILNDIQVRRGNLDLSFLKTVPIEEAREFLLSLKGVGPKTAACVLLFSCKRPVFPMDTHIFRILRRAGILPEKISDECAHQMIEQLIPQKKHYSLHINLITLGRQICHPRTPKCAQCSLIEHCEFGRTML